MNTVQKGLVDRQAESIATASPKSPQSPLDAALLTISTFPNGCDFRLVKDAAGDVWLEYGCYGVHRNLVQRHRRWLMEWMEQSPSAKRSLTEAKPETIAELLKRKPCDKCGAPFFAEPASRPPDRTKPLTNVRIAELLFELDDIAKRNDRDYGLPLSDTTLGPEMGAAVRRFVEKLVRHD